MKRLEIREKFENGKKSILISLRLRAAPNIWSKYTEPLLPEHYEVVQQWLYRSCWNRHYSPNRRGAGKCRTLEQLHDSVDCSTVVVVEVAVAAVAVFCAVDTLRSCWICKNQKFFFFSFNISDYSLSTHHW